MAKTLGVIATLMAVTGGLAVAQRPPADQRLAPGFVDPKPVLDAAVRAIGADKLKCLTISGTGYAGAVGQQFESGDQHRLAAGSMRWPTTRGR